MRYTLVQLLHAYCFVHRLYNGDPLVEPLQTLAILLHMPVLVDKGKHVGAAHKAVRVSGA